MLGKKNQHKGNASSCISIFSIKLDMTLNFPCYNQAQISTFTGEILLINGEEESRIFVLWLYASSFQETFFLNPQNWCIPHFNIFHI